MLGDLSFHDPAAGEARELVIQTFQSIQDQKEPTVVSNHKSLDVDHVQAESKIAADRPEGVFRRDTYQVVWNGEGERTDQNGELFIQLPWESAMRTRPFRVRFQPRLRVIPQRIVLTRLSASDPLRGRFEVVWGASVSPPSMIRPSNTLLRISESRRDMESRTIEYEVELSAADGDAAAPAEHRLAVEVGSGDRRYVIVEVPLSQERTP